MSDEGCANDSFNVVVEDVEDLSDGGVFTQVPEVEDSGKSLKRKADASVDATADAKKDSGKKKSKRKRSGKKKAKNCESGEFLNLLEALTIHLLITFDIAFLYCHAI